MLNSDYREMLECLLDERVEFLIVGACAMATHGVPRASGDIAIWVRPTADNAARVFRALARFGARLGDADPAAFSTPGLVLQLGIAPRRIDILTSIDAVAFEDAAQDRCIVAIDGLEIPVLSLERLMANKQATGRVKDLLDVELLLSAGRSL